MQSTLFSVGWKKNVEPVEEPVEESIVSESPDPSNKKNGRFARVKTVKKWNYDWLSYEQEEGTVTKIWCKICREFPEEATRQQHNGQKQFVDCEAYINGTNNVKICAVKAHSKSEGHEAARKASVAACNPESTPIAKSFRVLKKEENDKLVKLFNVAYYIAKEEKPFRDFPTLVKFELKKQGVDHLTTAYHNDKACRNFVESIAEVMEEELKHDLTEKRPGSYISIMFDGATDKALTEREIVCIKYMNKCGVPSTKFIG